MSHLLETCIFQANEIIRICEFEAKNNLATVIKNF